MLTFTGKTANFETWYESVKEYTPTSSMLHVSEEERAVIKARCFDHLSREIVYFSETNTREDTAGLNEEEILNQLIQRINQHIKGKTYFFRTNLFSPKDVKADCIISSGEEVLELMTSSLRLYKGFPLLKELDFYLVFREVTHFKEEFRCFVQDGEIIGISQCDDSNSITEHKGASTIYTLTNGQYLEVYHYLQQIIEDCEIDTAVLDIGMTKFGFLLIKINPFHQLTDKSLFVNTSIYSPEWRPTQIRYWVEKDVMRIITLELGAVHHIRDEKISITNNEEEDYFSDLMEQLKQLNRTI